MSTEPVKPATDHCETKECATGAPEKPGAMGWKELYLKEDWWAIYVGFGITLLCLLAFFSGSTFAKSLAINPGGLKWTPDTFGKVVDHFSKNIGLYGIQFLFWLVIFSITTKIMRIKTSEFIPAFIILYILSILAFLIGGWKDSGRWMLEPPIAALLIGLVIANVFPFPKWMDSGFRVEYYIKTGIVLLGATFPINLVISAGPLPSFRQR